MVFSYSDVYGISPVLTVSITAIIALIVKSAMRKSETAILIIGIAGIHHQHGFQRIHVFAEHHCF